MKKDKNRIKSEKELAKQIRKEEKDRIWKNDTFFSEKCDKIRTYIRSIKKKGLMWIFRKNRKVIIVNGRWNSTTKIPVH